jgi:hypothetical protein
MLPFNKANSITLTGLGIASVGVASYTQIGGIASVAATLSGLLIALVGSVIWMRKTSLRAPLALALAIGVAVFLLGLAGYVNVHGPAGILIFVFTYAVLDVMLLIGFAYW